MDGIPDITNLEMLFRVGIAAAAGALIGLEREWRDRAAGLRTHMMVGIGSAIFTVISLYGFNDWIEWSVAQNARVPLYVSDPGRIAAQIVSGIGFIGAGAIWRSKFSVHGITTASTLWAMAALGMAAGIGMYVLTIMSTLAILFTLFALRLVGHVIKDKSRAGTRRVNIEARASSASGVASLLEILGREEDIQVKQTYIGNISSDGGRTVKIDLLHEEDINLTKILAQINEDEIYSIQLSVLTIED